MKPEPTDILYGEIKVHQPLEGRGPRVSVDTVLLAHFARVKERAKVMELGCAHGAVSLIMARRAPRAFFEGIDINPSLVELALRNARLNGMEERVSFSAADLREHRRDFEAETYDTVVMNPPYDEPGSSRPSPDAGMATAMHGEQCTLEDAVICAKYLLRNGGKFFLVMRAKRLGELFCLLHRHNVKPKRMRAVHPKPGRAASVVLVEAKRASGDGVSVEPPLFIYGADGNYTEELLAAYKLEDCPQTADKTSGAARTRQGASSLDPLTQCRS
ncbi:MAG: methyltransferase [Synergistaceae bacterium]|jgi:tRNA1(Val) A37 N6-methylase TrmN6|nr:methyltransferase [Synergistaceae bacterium]